MNWKPKDYELKETSRESIEVRTEAGQPFCILVKKETVKRLQRERRLNELYSRVKEAKGDIRRTQGDPRQDLALEIYIPEYWDAVKVAEEFKERAGLWTPEQIVK